MNASQQSLQPRPQDRAIAPADIVMAFLAAIILEVPFVLWIFLPGHKLPWMLSENHWPFLLFLFWGISYGLLFVAARWLGRCKHARSSWWYSPL